MSLYKYIKYSLKKQSIEFSIYFILNIIVWIANLYIPILMGQFIDGILQLKNYKIIYKFTLLALSITTISVIAGYFLNIKKTKLTAEINNRLKFDILQSILFSDEIALNNMDRSYITQRMFADSEVIVSYIVNNLSGIIINILSFIFILILIFKINVEIGIILLILIPIYILLFIFFKKRILQRALILKENSSIYFQKFNEIINNTYFIKINGAFEQVKLIINKNFTTLMDSTMDYVKNIYLFSSMGSTLNSYLQIIIIFIGGIFIIRGKVTIGQFTIISSYFKNFIGNIKYFLEISKSYQDTLASIERIKSLEDFKKIKIGNFKIREINKIKFKNVYFSYDSQNILFKMNLLIDKPGIYIVSGKNGIGKSTFLNLLTGVIETKSGKIFINDIDIDNIDKVDLWRNRISFQQQNSALIGDNLVSCLEFGLNQTEKKI